MEVGQIKHSTIAILGAGSWGTALALYLARQGQHVKIWSIQADEINAMIADKANHRYLPNISLPDNIEPTYELADTIANVKDILMVVPSAGFRQTLKALKPLLNSSQRIICASKGIDGNKKQLLGDVNAEVLGNERSFAVLSGPSFAREVAAGLPCSVVIASSQDDFLQDLVNRFNSKIFRTHTSHDVVGVEIGGVVKNVIAIATGISDGMGLGANARSALITAGLAEITRLGVSMGGKFETFMGLSGMGDLILTCGDDQSRNRRLGLALGKGQDIATAEKTIGQAVEGKQNAPLVVALAKQQQVEMPICETVNSILQGEVEIEEAVINFR